MDFGGSIQPVTVGLLRCVFLFGAHHSLPLSPWDLTHFPGTLALFAPPSCPSGSSGETWGVERPS